MRIIHRDSPTIYPKALTGDILDCRYHSASEY